MKSRALYLCEKPAQAADLARVLGDAHRTSTHWETSAGRVTWCIGHLLRTQEPDELNPEKWGGSWRFEALPMLPDRLKFVPDSEKKARVSEIGRLLQDCDEVLIATDGGPEGEMIGREVLVHHRYEGPIRRVWLNALTEGAIRKALANILPGEETVRYYYAALARAEADWMIGMNGTRALTTRSPRGAGTVSVGRVQTPTVAMVVWRDREITNFKAQDYFELALQAKVSGGAVVTLRHAPTEKILDRAKAEGIARAAQGMQAPLQVENEPGKKTKAPAPFELNTLSKRANKLWRWKAKKTLKVAQALYETHKLSTYPRTDCKYLADDAAADVPTITANLLALPEFAALRGQTFKPGEWFNSAKVEGHDHDALRPTDNVPNLGALDEDERKLYLLIAQQYLASLLPPYVYDSVTVRLMVNAAEFKATGTTPVSLGWKVVYAGALKAEEEDSADEAPALPALKDGEIANVEKCEVEGKKTKPPRHYTEGTLLDDMMNVAKFVSDPRLKRILNSEDEKQKGIGTTATRADVLEDIQRPNRGYVEASSKGELIATPKAHAVITFIEKTLPALADPAETALWQIELDKIKDGAAPTEFMNAVKQRIREYIATLGKIDGKTMGAAMGIEEKGTGVRIPAHPDASDRTEPELIDRGKTFTAEGWPGNFFKDIAGIVFTAQQFGELVRAGMTGVEREAPSKFKGKPSVRVKVTFDAAAKPYPKVNIEWPRRDSSGETEGTPTGVMIGKTELLDCGDCYRAEGAFAGKIFKNLLGHALTPDEIGRLINDGETIGATDFKSAKTGRTYSASMKWKPRAKPFPKIEVEW